MTTVHPWFFVQCKGNITVVTSYCFATQSTYRVSGEPPSIQKKNYLLIATQSFFHRTVQFICNEPSNAPFITVFAKINHRYFCKGPSFKAMTLASSGSEPWPTPPTSKTSAWVASAPGSRKAA